MNNMPINLLCENQSSPANVNTNIPVFNWTFCGADTEKGYRILVSSSLSNIHDDIGDKWDSGHVWQWDYCGTNKKSQATYSGSALSPGTTYYWKVMTWDADNLCSGYSDIATFTTSEMLPDSKREAADKVFSQKNNDLYYRSLWSIQNRIQPCLFLGEVYK